VLGAVPNPPPYPGAAGVDWKPPVEGAPKPPLFPNPPVLGALLLAKAAAPKPGAGAGVWLPNVGAPKFDAFGMAPKPGVEGVAPEAFDNPKGAGAADDGPKLPGNPPPGVAPKPDGAPPLAV